MKDNTNYHGHQTVYAVTANLKNPPTFISLYEIQLITIGMLIIIWRISIKASR